MLVPGLFVAALRLQVGEEDGRVCLRGEKGVRPTRKLVPCTVLGPYAGGHGGCDVVSVTCGTWPLKC